MAQPHDRNVAPQHPIGQEAVEMPRPTVWPIVLSLGVLLIALGAATNLLFCVIGALLLVLGVMGWIVQLLPGQGHQHEQLEPATKPVAPRTGAVEQLKPGVVGYRFQVPEKVHPISAGFKGGILGGLLMPIPALIWGVWSGHTIWFPVNLLAGMVIPGLTDVPPDQLVPQLEAFHPWFLVGAIIMHAAMSIGFGLVGAVLLPTLPPIPGGPLVFGSLILPLLWSGANHSLMAIVNPLLNHYIDWRWYVVSQLVYGVTTTLVILRTEKIAIAPRGPGGDAGGPSIPPGWLGCLFFACVLLSGCSDNLPGKPLQADDYVMPNKIMDFPVLYAQRCAGCHGDDGTLGPGPPLNDPLFAYLVTEEELHSVIADGRRGTLMPAWAHSSGGPLTDDQVAVLVKGIKTAAWKPAGKPSSEKPKSQAVFPSAPPLQPASTDKTAGSAQAGEKIYAVACAECHGARGDGHDEAGPINNHAYLALTSDRQLRRYIITGRPDLGMPNFADTAGRDPDFKPLTSQQVSDLLALLAKWRETPPTQ